MEQEQFNQKIKEILSTEAYNPFAGIDSSSYESILRSHQNPSPVSIRSNPHKQTDLSVDLEPVPWCPWGYYLQERPVFTLDPLLHAGGYYVQEASSMFLSQVMQYIRQNTEEGSLKILDLCAAPGGKSTLLASHLSDDDILISNEVIQSRANILVENMTKWGCANTWVISNDPKEIGNALQNTFDVMLVDAPCTGSGLWRKDKEAINEWSAQHVKLCAERQKRILSDSYTALKKDGYLVYATCSFSPEEDEDVVDWLQDNFELENITIPVASAWNIIVEQSKKHKATGYHFYPWKLKGEGFYIAVFRKLDGSKEALKQKHKNKIKTKTVNNFSADWNQYLRGDWTMEVINDAIFAFDNNHKPFFNSIRQKVYVKKAGIRLGQETQKGVIPDHDLALSIHLQAGVRAIDVSKEEALRFLKKEPVAMEHNLKGWYLVRYRSLGLGWGKWMPGRMNNYLPKSWRIRMEID